MMDFIRSATLTHYPEVAQSVGLDPRQMLRKVRLPLASLERPDLRIAVTSVRRLLDISAIESGVEEFGLLSALSGATVVSTLLLDDANAVDGATFLFTNVSGGAVG